jgi:hypothetical protein
MKKTLLFIACATAFTAFADVNLPKSVHRMDEFDEARTEAQKEGKPITIIFSNEKSDCPYCNRATAMAISDLKQKSVVMFVDISERGKLTPAAQQAVNAKELGGSIPKTVVMDGGASKVIAYIPFSREANEFNKSLKEAKEKIEAEYGKPKKHVGPAPLPAAKPAGTARN